MGGQRAAKKKLTLLAAVLCERETTRPARKTDDYDDDAGKEAREENSNEPQK